MTPGAALYNSIAARLATDPAQLGLTTFLQAIPIIASYVPNVTLTPAMLSLGTGSLAPLAATIAPIVGIDPATGQQKILIPPPAGGWKWAYDGTTPTPPVTVFGFAVSDVATGLKLIGVTTPLNPPVTLNVASLLIEDEISFLVLNPPLQ